MSAVIGIAAKEMLEASWTFRQALTEVELGHGQLVVVGVEHTLGQGSIHDNPHYADMVGSMNAFTTDTALIVVDCQNDFADPTGSLYVRGAAEVLAAANREIIRAVTAGALVVYTQDWHPGDTPHFEKDGGIWPVHCVGGTWGAELHPRLVVAGPRVRKGVDGSDGYSGFTTRDPETGETSPTELSPLVVERGARRVVVVGLALDYCVKETAMDAVNLGFETHVVADATAAVEVADGDGERARRDLADGGVRFV